MRIQHNIMAMGAYRNYTNNVNAMKKNLEKLSSGYKINRAGDDAAGLAISEKMRAQITGLETAQKNAKDGISLVQTAEGALTEVHDMLNRMVTLATQSANGTYDNETDRYQLQKEMDQLRSEIDRIADSSNFNGIKLLDGSLDAEGIPTKEDGTNRIISTVWNGSGDPSVVTGKETILDGDPATEAKATIFEMDFSDLKALAGAATAATTASGTVSVSYASTPTWANGDRVTLTAAGGDITCTAVASYDGTNWTVTNPPTGFDVTFDGTDFTFTSQTSGEIASGVDLGTLSASVSCAAAPTLTSGTATGTITNGTNAVAAGAAIKTDVKINNVAMASNVSLSANDGAEEIAQKVLDAMSGTAGTTTLANHDLFGDGTLYTVEVDGSKLRFTLEDEPTASNIKGNFSWDATITGGNYEGNHTAGTNPTQAGSVASAGARANTVFKLTTADMKDGTKITIDDKTITLSVGSNSTVAEGSGVVKLTEAEANDLDLALSKIAEGFAGETTNFEVSVNNQKNDDVSSGLAVYKKADSGKTYKTKEELAKVFSITTPGKGSGKALTLQIGDTAEDFNQLKVSIGDAHTSALGIDKISIADQDSAAKAVDILKNAINQVSDIRGTLGATQNRLDHTINNLSVMTENIQDAESTIRDTDVAEEMMEYTKNNILIQSAQAMLAQANQVPQGVLQLLQ